MFTVAFLLFCLQAVIFCSINFTGDDSSLYLQDDIVVLQAAMFLCLQEVIFSCVYRWWYSVVFISRNILVCLQAEIFCCVYRQWLWRTPLSGCPLTQPGTIVGGLGVTWSAFTVLERTRLSRILSGKCIFCINIIMPGISLCFSLFILAIFSKKQILFEKKQQSFSRNKN